MSQAGQFNPDSGGGGNLPDLPAFFVYWAAATGDVTGDGTNYTMGTDPTPATILYDQVGNISGIGGSTPLIFTANSSGIYYFYFAVSYASASNTVVTFAQRVITTSTTYLIVPGNLLGFGGGASPMSAMGHMSAGDTATFTCATVNSGAGTVSLQGNGGGGEPQTYILGYKVA